MTDSNTRRPGEFDTRIMQDYIERMRADPKVRDDLYRAVESRLIRLSRHMLRDFPRLAVMTEAEDILQAAAMRLMRALQTITPVGTREFFQLATVQLKRELIDLTRQYFGPLGQGRNEVLLGGMEDGGPSGLGESVTTTDSIQEMEHWTEFHEKIEELPAQEREVFSLVYYHGMNQEKIGGILGVTERTVRRYWRGAVARLKKILSPECMAKLVGPG